MMEGFTGLEELGETGEYNLEVAFVQGSKDTERFQRNCC
jgi:hypothetical protein